MLVTFVCLPLAETVRVYGGRHFGVGVAGSRHLWGVVLRRVSSHGVASSRTCAGSVTATSALPHSVGTAARVFVSRNISLFAVNASISQNSCSVRDG